MGTHDIAGHSRNYLILRVGLTLRTVLIAAHRASEEVGVFQPMVPRSVPTPVLLPGFGRKPPPLRGTVFHTLNSTTG